MYKHFSIKSLISLILALGFASLFVSPALAINSQALCTSTSGAWAGLDGSNGTCTYAAGDPTEVSSCGNATSTYVITYVADVETTAVCSSTVSTGSSGGGNTVSSEGPRRESFTLNLNGHNGSVTFGQGTCTQNCTINPKLPNVPDNSVPSTALATLYVRVVASGGVPGTGSYKVCFQNKAGRLLKIYRYASGKWVAQTTSSKNPICLTTSGEGSFYLGR